MIKNFIVTIVIASYFFAYTVNNLNLTYDRYSPQFLYLSIINIISIGFILRKYSAKKFLNLFVKSNPILLYTAFIITSGVSIIVAENQIESIIVFSQYLTFFFTLLVVYVLSKELTTDFVKLLFSFCVISLVLESSYILSILFEKLYINGEEFTRSNDYRGFTANINITAFSLVIKSPVLLFFIFKSNKLLNKFLLLFLLTAVTSCLFILLSRASFIAFAFTLFLICLYAIINNMDKRLLKTSMIVFAILISYSFMNYALNTKDSSIISDRISSIQVDTEDQSINERLRFYKAALYSISKHPILGIGIGNWKIESIKYDSKYMGGYRIPFHAHNDFLQITAESGIISLLFFLSFLFYPFFNFIKKKIYKQNNFYYFTLLIMIVTYIIDSLLNFPISRPISHVFLIFIMVAFIGLFNNNERENI